MAGNVAVMQVIPPLLDPSVHVEKIKMQDWASVANVPKFLESVLR